MKRLIIFLFSIIIYTSVIGQQYVVVSVTSFTNIILQPLGGGPTIRTGCVEHSDIVPYVGQIYTDMGGDCYEAPEAAYQNVCFIPGCEINFDNVIEQPTCGQNNGYISITVVQDGTYEYNFNNQGWSSNNVWTNLPTGEYTVLARNVDGSCEGFQSVLLYNETAGLMMTAIPSVCNPVTNTYDVSVVIAGTGFPNGNLNVSLAGQTRTVSAPFPNPTTVTFTGLQANGPNTIPVVGTFTFFPPYCTLNTTYTAPAPCGQLCTMSLTSLPSDCTPATNQYTVNGTMTFTDAPTSGTLTVSVSGGGSQVFNVPFTSPQAYTISGLTSDGANHTVTAQFSAIAGCNNTSTYTAPVNCTPPPCSVTLTAVPSNCNNTNNQYYINGAVTFSNAPTTGSLIVSVSGGGSQTFAMPQTSPVNYTINGLESDGSSHTVTVSFSDNPSCTNSVMYSAPASCGTPCPPSLYSMCAGESYTLTAATGNSGYQWYTVVGATETPINGATSNTLVVTAAGTYIWKATDGGSCPIALCCPVTVQVVSPIVSCSVVTSPGCGQSNGSATVAASGGNGAPYTYVWSTTPAQSLATATNLAAGTYTVTVTDGGMCTATCSVVLSNPNGPSAMCSNTAPGCGLANGTATVSPSGGVGPYTYIWSTFPVQTGITAIGISAGTYTVTVTDNSNCSTTCSTTLTAPGGPQCLLAANTQPSCADLNGGSVTVSGAGGTAPYTFQWSNGQGGTTATGLSGGIYTVTVTDANNCSSTCTGALTTPMNCCNINAVTAFDLECLDNGTPNKITDNRIRFRANVTNTNLSLTGYNVTVNGGTTITPNTNVAYGITQFTLGAGTAGGGSTFTVTVTDSATPGCMQTFQVVDPGNCTPAIPECPPVKCGTATIQVNGN